jgi:hypothetical protein
VDMRGRLGNQMFQVAFAHAASMRLGTSFAVLGPFELAEHFERPPLRRPSVRLAAKAMFHVRHRRTKRVFIDDECDPAVLLASLDDGTAYSGFFQSAQYFAGYERDVRNMFQIRSTHASAFERAYSELDRYVCVHVRRGDYFEAGWALPGSYFRDAMAAVSECSELPVVVVSDDIGRAREDCARMDCAWVERARFVANSPAIDLQLLMNASVVIASNSSFSWWGGWLNARPDVRVVAPASWLGLATGIEHPPGVIPPGWIKIPVERPSL